MFLFQFKEIIMNTYFTQLENYTQKFLKKIPTNQFLDLNFIEYSWHKFVGKFFCWKYYLNT